MICAEVGVIIGGRGRKTVDHCRVGRYPQKIHSVNNSQGCYPSAQPVVVSHGPQKCLKEGSPVINTVDNFAHNH